jgi:hypothetical protein
MREKVRQEYFLVLSMKKDYLGELLDHRIESWCEVDHRKTKSSRGEAVKRREHTTNVIKRGQLSSL